MKSKPRSSQKQLRTIPCRPALVTVKATKGSTLSLPGGYFDLQSRVLDQSGQTKLVKSFVVPKPAMQQGFLSDRPCSLALFL